MFSGTIKFKPGEKEKRITISLKNDPAAGVNHFFVDIIEVQGRDKLGDKQTCKVVVTNEQGKIPSSSQSNFN